MKVLFVCLGNICRSPTAEAVLRHVATVAAPDIDWLVESAGTHGYHIGAPPDPRTVAAAQRRGIDMTSLRARVVEEADFHRFDLVLAMDEVNLAHLQAMRPANAAAEVGLLMDYAPRLGRRDVPDPYYGSHKGFEEVLDLVEAAVEGLIEAARARRV